MANSSYSSTTGAGATCSVVISTDTYGCRDESYKTEPRVYFRYNAHSFYGWYMVSYANSMYFNTNTTWGERRALSVELILSSRNFRVRDNPNDSDTPWGEFYEESGQSQGGYASVTTTGQYAQQVPADVLSWGDWRVDDAPIISMSTNLPIFATNSAMNDYIRTGVGLENAVNYLAPEESPEGEMFTITNMWTHGVWLNDTQPQVTEIHYRNFRAKMTSGKFALYKIDGIDDNKLKYGIKNDAEFYDMKYSTDGSTWISTDTFPFEYFLRKRINELGEFDYALTYSNSYIPQFKDEATAQGYIDGDVDITDADNWNEISEGYPIDNVTAEPDDNTEMGHVYTRSFFSQQYICSWQAVQQISNAFFETDANIFTNIKKGLEMFGERIIDSIQSIAFYPIDLTQVFTNVSNLSYIYFGGYQFNLANGVTVSKITFPDGYYDFGTFYLTPHFSQKEGKIHYRDYSPYCRLFCYLAYIGWVELDTARYMGHNVNVRYYFDTRTGMCMACLFVQTDATVGAEKWVLYDYYQGQIALNMPITLTDFTSYANAQIQTLLGGASDTKGNMGTVFNAGANMAEKGLLTTGSAMALGSVGALGVGIGATKTLYGLTQNNINNFNKTKGSSSSMLNMFLPQEIMFMFEYQQGENTPNELGLVGYPSNTSGQLQNFSGYLEVDAVRLECPYATENEKADIIRQLQSGVYLSQIESC